MKKMEVELDVLELLEKATEPTAGDGKYRFEQEYTSESGEKFVLAFKTGRHRKNFYRGLWRILRRWGLKRYKDTDDPRYIPPFWIHFDERRSS